jgi:hypothetical protein
MVTRRDFIGSGISLAGAASSAPMPAGAAPDPSRWWLSPVRLFHPNMRESELRGFDTGRFVGSCAATNAGGIVVNAGGIVAFYPSKVPYHYVSPLLNGHDFLKEVTTQLHAAGIKNVHTLRGGAALAFEARDGRIRFTVPVLNAYEVAVIETAAA